MTLLRVVETYVSYQGEGPNTSRPTVFVRFAGCNFKCPGWPCDTQHAIQPEQFRKLQRHYSPELLAQEVLALGVDNVCLTGGEVFLQNSGPLTEFVQALKHATEHAINIECFTNGSLPWPETVSQLVDNFILDWKLSGSGEDYTGRALVVLTDNMRLLNQSDAIKFTIASRADYEEAKQRYDVFADKTVAGPKVYAGVVWGKLTTEELCAWMIADQLPWHLNVQVHKFIWHPDKQGV